jgi:iron complex transport system substrate-binding protein
LGALAVPRVTWSQTPAASPVAGWSFTDDRGVTASLPSRPTVLAAQTISAASLWDFGIEVDGVFGGIVLEDGTTPDPQLGNVDPSAVRDLGTFGALDIESLVEMGVQVFVDVDRGGGLWSLSPDEEALVLEVAQTIAISTQISAEITVARFEELAVSLGADPASEVIAQGKARYEAAADSVRTIAASKPDLRVIVLTGTADNVYVVNPEKAGSLSLYRALGVDVVIPESTDPAQLDVFETLSWEAVGTYPADVILWDARFPPEGTVPESIWNALPAVAAHQVGSWESVYPNSWQGLAAVLENLADVLESAEPVG